MHKLLSSSRRAAVLVLAALLTTALLAPVQAAPGTQAAVAQAPAKAYEPGPVGPFVGLEQVRQRWSDAEKSMEPPHMVVKGIYLTAYSAANPEKRDELLALIDRTELNAIVVNVKDDWGNITYDSNQPLAKAADSVRPELDLKAFTSMLKEKKIYSIARIVTFKDNHVPVSRPDLAVARTGGGIWRDYNGVPWMNAYNRETWEYVVDIAREVAMSGFDEIQFDYVRFPSDGNMDTLAYPGKDNRERQQVIADFLAYAKKELHPYGVWISADAFGLVTSLPDDLGIGQHLEEMSAGVDYLSPMVYPSHYIPGNLGLSNPNAMPYETVYRSMMDTKERWEKAGLTGKVEMRPWLQDFSWGYPYGRKEVRDQIQATYDAGYKGWLLWNAANVYTESALKPAGAE